MKREFLQNLKVGELFLTKDVIDAIMAENGRDIESAKQLGNTWEEKYNQAVQAHQQELGALRFQSALEAAVRGMDLLGSAPRQMYLQELLGFSHPAYGHVPMLMSSDGRRLSKRDKDLDLDAIRGSVDLPGALKNAVEAVKKEHDYLFVTQTPPLYARGTGTQTGETQAQSATLAGALREKYERK